MTAPATPGVHTPGSLRRLVYPLLITLAAGAVAGKILAVARLYEPYLSRPDPGQTAAAIVLPLGASNAPEAAALLAAGYAVWKNGDPEEQRGVWPPTRPEPMPTLGDNDRSRWDTVRALVDDGTYAIGYRIANAKDPKKYHDHGIITQDGWKTVDKVLRPGPAGERQEFFSSKPPLVATLVAGEYWLLKHAFGWSITEDSWWVARTILFTFNWLPLVLYLVLLSRLVDRLGTTDWGRLYVLAAGCLGTLLLPFSITLNNHTLAACSALFALYPVLHIWQSRAHLASRGRQPPEEAPAEAPPEEQPMAAGGGPRGPVRVSAWSFALAGFFAAFTAAMELPATSLAVALLFLLLWLAPRRTLFFFVPAAAVPVAAFLGTNYLAIGQLRPAYSEFGGPWYEYEGSHWKPAEPGQEKRGIDFAQENKAVYAFHVLLGHHGFFSLSPIFLLAAGGMAYALFLRARAAGPPQAADLEPGIPIRDSGLRGVVILTVLISAVVVGFYIYQTHNYGGWTSGMRWLIWLTPLWLLSLLPAADWLSTRRWGRGLAYVCLGLSVLSAHYPPWNPWRHPWLYRLLESFGWIPY